MESLNATDTPAPVPAPEPADTRSVQEQMAAQVSERMQHTIGALYRQLNEQVVLNQTLVNTLQQRDAALVVAQRDLRLARDELVLARKEIEILREARPPLVASQNPNRKRK